MYRCTAQTVGDSLSEMNDMWEMLDKCQRSADPSALEGHVNELIHMAKQKTAGQNRSDNRKDIPFELLDLVKWMIICKERRYLFSIIKPSRDRVIYIGKFTEGDDTDKSFIEIGIDGDLEIVLPSFAKNQMYLGMKDDRKYALKELEM